MTADQPMPASSPPKDREQHYRALFDEMKNRGLRMTDLAKERGIPYTTLQYWRRRLAKGAKAKKSRHKPAQATFARVEVATATQGSPSFELQLPRQRTLRVPVGFDAEELQRLLQVLSATC